MIIRRNGIVLQIATILLIALVSLFSTSCAGSNHLYKEAYSSYIYKDYTHAMELLDSIIKNDRGYTQAYLLKSTIYEVQGDMDNALNVLIAAKQSPNADENVSFNLGNIYFMQQEYVKAADEYSQALKLNPGFLKALLNRANSYMKQKKYRLALTDYQSFLALTPEGYDNVRKLVILLAQDLAAIGQ